MGDYLNIGDGFRMNIKSAVILFGLLLMMVALSGCTTQAAQTTPSTGESWSLKLAGDVNETLSHTGFETIKQIHNSTWENAGTWDGIPLWVLAGRVDDTDADAFNVTLAERGYTVRVIGIDGYNIDFDVAQIQNNDGIIVADRFNGEALMTEYWPLRLVGNELASGQMVRNIAEIQLIF